MAADEHEMCAEQGFCKANPAKNERGSMPPGFPITNGIILLENQVNLMQKYYYT
jgi:hypothetical protein